MGRANKGRASALGIVTACAAATATVQAQTWIGGGATDAWSDPANWSPAVPFADVATQLTFGPGAGSGDYTSTNDIPGNLVLSRLSFTGSGYRRTILGNTLEFAAAADGTLPEVLNLTAASGFGTIKAPIRLDVDTTFRSIPNSGGIGALGGISGPGKLTVVGSFGYGGLLDATFTGGADVTGTLTVDAVNDTPTPAFGTGAITFHGNSTYRTGSSSRPLTIATPIAVDGNLTMDAVVDSSAFKPPLTLDADVRVSGAFRYAGRAFVHAAGRRLLLDNAGPGSNTLQFDSRVPVQVNANVADTNPAAPSNPLLIRAAVDTAFTGQNTFGGDVTVDGFRSATDPFGTARPYVSFSAASTFAGNLIVTGTAGARLDSPAAIAPGKTATIGPAAVLEFAPSTPFDTALLRAKINPASTGILAINPPPGFDLTGFPNLLLGAGSRDQFLDKPYTPADRTFRLATAGTRDFVVRPGALTGDNALTVGISTSTGSSRGTSFASVNLQGQNTFTGGTTILNGTLDAGQASLGTGPVRVVGNGALVTFETNALTGANSLDVSDRATVDLRAPNDYAGGTLLHPPPGASVTLWAGADRALGTGPVTIQNGTLVMLPVAPVTSLTFPNVFHVNAGELRIGNSTITNTVYLAAGARLQAIAGVVDSLVGAGSVYNPGFYSPSPATFTVRHDLSPGDTPGAAANFVVGDPKDLFGRLGLVLTPTSNTLIDLVSPTSHDRVLIGAAATLDGTLTLALAPGFIPAPGSTFDVVTFVSRTGEFDSIVVAGPNAPAFDVQYLSDRVRVVVTPEPASMVTLTIAAWGSCSRRRRWSPANRPASRAHPREP